MRYVLTLRLYPLRARCRPRDSEIGDIGLAAEFPQRHRGGGGKRLLPAVLRCGGGYERRLAHAPVATLRGEQTHRTAQGALREESRQCKWAVAVELYHVEEVTCSCHEQLRLFFIIE